MLWLWQWYIILIWKCSTLYSSWTFPLKLKQTKLNILFNFKMYKKTGETEHLYNLCKWWIFCTILHHPREPVVDCHILLSPRLLYQPEETGNGTFVPFSAIAIANIYPAATFKISLIWIPWEWPRSINMRIVIRISANYNVIMNCKLGLANIQNIIYPECNVRCRTNTHLCLIWTQYVSFNIVLNQGKICDWQQYLLIYGCQSVFEHHFSAVPDRKTYNWLKLALEL